MDSHHFSAKVLSRGICNTVKSFYNVGMVVTAIISILVGFLVGVFSGLLGVGGGTILVPIFSVAFGLAPVMATGTSLFTIFFTSISGAWTRIRNKTCNIKVGIAMGLGGAITSPLGAYVSTLSPEIVVVLAVALVILYSIVSTFKKALKDDSAHSNRMSPDTETFGNTQSQVEQAAAARHEFTASLGIRSVIIGLIAGFLSGFVGLGGGFLMIPLMRNLLDYSMKEASGTSLLGILFIALSGAIAQINFGNVNFLIGIPIVIGSIPGAIVGASLVSRFRDKTLSFAFCGFLFVATVLFILKQFGLLG